MEVLEYLKDLLMFIGLALNLLGTYKIYHSIKAFPNLLMDISDKESYPPISSFKAGLLPFTYNHKQVLEIF